MGSYPLVESAVALFDPMTCTNDEEAITILQKQMRSDPRFDVALKESLRSAFADPGFLWHPLLEKNDVESFDGDERAARAYAIGILWKPFFADVPPPAMNLAKD